jgi:hypothetical protein
MADPAPSTERRRPARYRMAAGWIPEHTYNALNLAAEGRGMTVEGLVAKLLQIIGREDAIRLILNETRPANRTSR